MTDSDKSDTPSTDEQSGRMREALGVEEPANPEAATSETAEETPQNRAARRAEEARQRRGEGAEADRNLKARELLQRRRESAEEKRPVQLLASERVDDALSRGTTGSLKWLKANSTAVQGVLAFVLVAGGAGLYWKHRMDDQTAALSAVLGKATLAERGRVSEGTEETSEEDKRRELYPVFKSAAEREEKALAGYRDAAARAQNKPAGALGKLGEAGILLDRKDFDGAKAAYEGVLASSLAKTDDDVKARALEGLGFVLEGKGDLDAAMGRYQELQQVAAVGYRELGLYHQGRLLEAKGDIEGAKAKIKEVYEKVTEVKVAKHPFTNLGTLADERLAALDPTHTPKRALDSAMDPEELQRLIEQLKSQAGKGP